MKLAKACGKMKELAEFLIKAEHENSPVSNNNSMIVNVINECASLGMLDQAHDLLDEMRMSGIRTGASVYSIRLELLRIFNQISSDTERYSRSFK